MPGTPARIVITDYEFDSIEIEQAVAEAGSAELYRAHCKTEDDVICAASEADGLLVQYAPITERVLAALPHLKVIGRYGVGVDNIDVRAATARGVAVCNVPDYGIDDVSDHAIALAVSLARGIPALDRGIRQGQNCLPAVEPIHRISTQVFGVIGLGLIGTATARKARSLGYTVVGCDALRPPGTTTEDGIPVLSFRELLATSDVVSLHVPLNTHTLHLINSEALENMKPSATIINTCRGAVVDTTALVDALRNGHLRAAGLDVFEEEPLPLDSPLLELNNVALTPHTAWYSQESHEELKRRTTQNVIDVCFGRRPRNILNPGVLPHRKVVQEALPSLQ
jgi:D-3-phosphoglycerate dehydrogenase / 2-oxoglutarate reductase